MTDFIQHYSLRWLARVLGVPLPLLKRVAANTASYYRPFPLKDRTIDRPVGVLDDIQKRIKKIFLQPIRFPDSFHGGIKGHSPLTNASQHLNQKCLVKIDIRKFYPSVTSATVYQIWTHFGFGPDIASVLTRLTTYAGHLPLGTSTSGYLANLALVPSDSRVAEISKALQLRHTFFVDDISLSGDRPREAVGSVIDVIREAGFAVGRKKTEIMSNNEAQVVTGLCVNRRHGATVPRAEIDKIRCGIHELRINHQQGEPTERLERKLRGRIAHVRRTNLGAATRLERLLNSRLEMPAR